MRRRTLPLLGPAFFATGLLAQLLGPEFPVNSTTAGAQVNPAVAGNANGAFVVAWITGVYPISNVYARRFDANGAPVGGDFRVNTYSTGLQYAPAVAMNGAGDFVVTWADASVQRQVWAQRYASGSGAPLGGAFRVDASGDGAYSPRVTFDAGGRFVVAWQAEPSSKIMVRRYDSSGAALGGPYQVNATAGESPDLTATANGGFVVVWSANIVTPGLQWGRAYDASGGALGAEFPVSSAVGTTADHVVPRVAPEAGGGFTVTWMINAGQEGLDVLARRFDSGGAPAGSEFQVELQRAVSLSSVPTKLDLAADGGGSLIAWTQQVGARQEIRARELPGGEFRVNTYTTDVKGGPAVSALALGRFVVVWHSVGQDGSR